MGEFLYPKESIKYSCGEEVEYEGGNFNLFITDRRLVLHKTKGLVFKKERVASEDLVAIQRFHYEDKEMDRGILTVETSKKKRDIIGSRDIIKETVDELQKCIRLAWVHAKVYLERTFLAQNEAFAWSLARRVKEKASKCCVCGDGNVSVWIFDWLYDTSSEASLIFTRLFCKKHEIRWKEGELLNYKKINGVLILDRYLKPVDTLINRTWRETTSKLPSCLGKAEAKELTLQTLIDYLTRTTHLIYKGEIGEFLERVERAQEFLERK